ncbi:hypothetical protein [Actinoplanes awajinensis]|uniref:Uncharacterized protein n=1 Tax=Actinoplanes awajinensis subsp. mycoplanecinus TaxID=135947 RepID=A0A101JQK6_9ACTN|nr:hypothetical protein [Actinoplanes awajinensis]KUL30828.1 hypothetical protein ADL15_22955 [Actinoplanes awajinensis subsp. mycoplanecinus]
MTDLDEILEAARELSRAGRWSRALSLLDAAGAGDTFRVALAAAEVAAESDWFGGTELSAGRIAVAAGLGEHWDLDLLRLKQSYALAIRSDGADPAVSAQAGQLHDRAPDDVRRGWARMYQGLIADNLLGRRDLAPGHYAAALRAGVDGADPLLEREALRHLGDHDRDGGDRAAAQTKWARATELSSRAGLVPGLLSQQILLAVLARDAGDEAGARMLAGEVARSAGAIGADRLHAQATAFLTA